MAQAGTACFYTDPINSRPDVRVEKIGSERVTRGGSVDLVAYIDDPDDDTLGVDWFVRACAAGEAVCEDVEQVALGDAADQSSIRANMPAFVGGLAAMSMRANVVVTDLYGAESTDMLYLQADNQAPTATLHASGVRGPFGGWRSDSTVKISADISDGEGDGVAVTWDDTPPRGLLPDEYSSGPAGDAYNYEVRALVGGAWTVAITVTDDLLAVGDDEIIFVVDDDAAPCIVAESPEAAAGIFPLIDEHGDVGPRRFSVLHVDDDLDLHPVPAGADAAQRATVFRWSLAGPDTGGAFVPVGGNVADFVLDPDLFDPGELLSLRVEVDDRQGRALPCSADQATCSVGGDRDLDGDHDDDVCEQRRTWQVLR